MVEEVGLIVFKRIQGLAGRKFVNPAAIAKLLILGLLFMPVLTTLYDTSALLPSDHDSLVLLQNPDVVDSMGLYAWKYPEVS